MITPNRLHIKGEEITDEDMALLIKKTRLNLQRARLKVGLPMELEPISKPEEKKFHDLGCEIQHTGDCNCKDENYEQKPDEELSEEKKKLIQSIPF